MLGWLWVRIKAMHWAAKLASVAFLLQAGVFLAQAYQLKHLKAPAFNELQRAEGRLILVKKGRDWLTGIERPDGSSELFTCALPGTGTKNFCFMRSLVDRYKLDAKPEVILWWYPITTPLEDRVYRHIFQIQLKGESKPLSFKRTYGGKVFDEISYSYEHATRGFDNKQAIRGKVGMALLYAFAVVFLFSWGSYKYSRRA